MLLEIRRRSEGEARPRDPAAWLCGSALRRTRLAALTVDDVKFCREGLRLTTRRSKTDQDAAGTVSPSRTSQPSRFAPCAPCANGSTRPPISSGPIFRSFSLQRELSDRAIDGQDVASLVQTLARRARLEGDFGAHSLRAGFVTVAAQAKVSLDAIARTTRHKSLAVLRGYVRPGTGVRRRCPHFDDRLKGAL